MRRFSLVALCAIVAIAQLSATKAVPIIPVSSASINVNQNERQADDFSVLTYNIKGLPWPIASGRDDAFELIESRLLDMRRKATHPRVIVVQEAFTDRAKQIGANSGYVFSAYGPPLSQSPAKDTNNAKRFLNDATIFKGETTDKWLDSGLAVFSDYPILRVMRIAFPASACAGFDCLANKGALLVELQVPGKKIPVTLITTHLNSKRGAKVSEARSLEAYQRQISILTDFVRVNHQQHTPLILAGDFNASSPARLKALTQAPFMLGDKVKENALPSGLDMLRGIKGLDQKTVAEASFISRRGRDWQFFINGADSDIKPVRLKIPFGREKDGTMFSDHLGFSIAYRISEAS